VLLSRRGLSDFAATCPTRPRGTVPYPEGMIGLSQGRKLSALAESCHAFGIRSTTPTIQADDLPWDDSQNIPNFVLSNRIGLNL